MTRRHSLRQRVNTSSTSGSSILGWLSGAAGTPEVPTGAFGTWRGRQMGIMGTFADNFASTTHAYELQTGFLMEYTDCDVNIAVGGLYNDQGETHKAVALGSGAIWQQWHDRNVASLQNLASLWKNGKHNHTVRTLHARYCHEFNGDWYPWYVGPGSDAQQSVTITGSPTGGTFTLTFGGQTTTALPYNASASQVQSALAALSSVNGTWNVKVGNPFGYHIVTFIHGLGSAPQTLMTASSSLTGGSSPSVAVAHVTLGETTGGPGYFKTTFQMWADLARTYFPELSTEWCVNYSTSTAMDIRLAWPGNRVSDGTPYAKVYLLDFYNVWPWRSTGFSSHELDTHWYKDSSFSTYPPLGNEAHRRQALAFGVPLGISEWGNPAFDESSGGGSGGGDAPGFFDYMFSWMTANAGTGAGKFVYDIYFNAPNFNAGDLVYCLWHNKIPADVGPWSPLPAGSPTTLMSSSAARYKAQWGTP